MLNHLKKVDKAGSVVRIFSRGPLGGNAQVLVGRVRGEVKIW
jgi:hypothetical protein